MVEDDAQNKKETKLSAMWWEWRERRRNPQNKKEC